MYKNKCIKENCMTRSKKYIKYKKEVKKKEKHLFFERNQLNKKTKINTNDGKKLKTISIHYAEHKNFFGYEQSMK